MKYWTSIFIALFIASLCTFSLSAITDLPEDAHCLLLKISSTVTVTSLLFCGNLLTAFAFLHVHNSTGPDKQWNERHAVTWVTKGTVDDDL
jgi:hypothetical protein